MLKVYTVDSFVSIDSDAWKSIGTIGYKMKDDMDGVSEKIWFENITFKQCFELLETESFDGIYKDYTLFRNRPLISIRTLDYDRRYETFNSISYKDVYKEDSSVSLDWIMKHCSAEQAIQYLKERGITACPIAK